MYLSLLVLYDAKCSFLFLKKHKRGIISGVFVGLNGNRKRQGRGVDHLFVFSIYIFIYIFSKWWRNMHPPLTLLCTLLIAWSIIIMLINLHARLIIGQDHHVYFYK
jgi:hypothetical protein